MCDVQVYIIIGKLLRICGCGCGCGCGR